MAALWVITYIFSLSQSTFQCYYNTSYIVEELPYFSPPGFCYLFICEFCFYISYESHVINFTVKNKYTVKDRNTLLLAAAPATKGEKMKGRRECGSGLDKMTERFYIYSCSYCFWYFAFLCVIQNSVLHPFPFA